MVQQTVKNMGRFSEVLRTMTRFGFATVVERLGFDSYIPTFMKRRGESSETAQPWPVRVRLLFENLGPRIVEINPMNTLAGNHGILYGSTL